MIVDSSAIIPILVEDPGYRVLMDAVKRARNVGIGTPTLLEVSMVLAPRIGPEALALVEGFLRESEGTVISFNEQHCRVAMDAFLRYGKGRHPARLNFGDCMTYAVAKLSGEPLLCLGDDFAQTDLELVS